MTERNVEEKNVTVAFGTDSAIEVIIDKLNNLEKRVEIIEQENNAKKVAFANQIRRGH